MEVYSLSDVDTTADTLLIRIAVLIEVFCLREGVFAAIGSIRSSSSSSSPASSGSVTSAGDVATVATVVERGANLADDLMEVAGGARGFAGRMLLTLL